MRNTSIKEKKKKQHKLDSQKLENQIKPQISHTYGRAAASSENQSTKSEEAKRGAEAELRAITVYFRKLRDTY